MWQLAFVLPNLQCPIRIQDPMKHVAWTTYDDPRVTAIRTSQVGAGKLLDGFHDIYNHAQQPSTMIWRDDISYPRCRMKMFVDFRNVVAISAILPGWAAIEPDRPVTPHNPLWSDAFHFYPARLAPNGSISTINPALAVGSHSTTPFRGMPYPGIPVYTDAFSLDWPLFAHLMGAWEKRYLRAGTAWRTHEPLFRSLEMAYRALELPISNEAGMYDFGTSLGLWVSACEILAHADQEYVMLTDVLTQLERATWSDPLLQQRRFTVRYGRDRRQRKSVAIAGKVYESLYSGRNDFLHGNRVFTDSWRFRNKRITTSVGNLAPLVYRTLLLTYLGSGVPSRLRQHMSGAVEYPRDVPAVIDDETIACANQMYEDAFLRLI